MRRAKSQLADGWIMAVIATLIFGVITGVADNLVFGIIIQGPMMVGYVYYIMYQADHKKQDFNLLFKGFNNFTNTLVSGLLYTLAVGIGTAILIVPGIIVACGFSQTFFIQAENPSISGVDALKMSWNMMNGKKWDYFCLQLRFIGWMLLCILTCGIGFLWLTPYMTTTNLNYYRQIRYGSY